MVERMAITLDPRPAPTNTNIFIDTAATYCGSLRMGVWDFLATVFIKKMIKISFGVRPLPKIYQINRI